jgi:GT2 family glycosyltransferase
MTKSIAIIILNYNGKSLLEKFLPQVVDYSTEANIHVIDNASTDDSIIFLKNNFPQIHCIRLDKNYGYAGGYNLGVQQINEPIWCLLNSDIEVTPNWLSPIIELFKKDEKIAAIQPKILDFKNKAYFEYAGAGGGFIDAFGIPYCRGRVFEKIKKDNGQYNDVKEVFWASGACFFVKRDAFLNLNGFDESFFAHQEEIDLCWRLKNDGYKIYYQGHSTVFHVGGATLKAQNPKKTYLNFRNSLVMLHKNLPKKVLLQRLFLRMIIDGLIGIRFLLSGKINHTFAIIRAHLSYYKKMSKIKRGENLLKSYYHTYSIIWTYYFKKS